MQEAYVDDAGGIRAIRPQEEAKATKARENYAIEGLPVDANDAYEGDTSNDSWGK